MILKKLLAISLMMSSIDAWKILVLAPFPIYSRWLYIESFIENLLTNGHSVDAITPYYYSKTADKYFGIVIPEIDIEEHYSSKDMFTGKFESDITHLQTLYKFGLAVSENALNDTQVRSLMRNRGSKYNLILADHALQDSLFIFAKKFECPIVTLGVDGYVSYMDEAMGISTPYTLIPHTITKYDYKMNFFQRCYNVMLYMYEGAVRKFSYFPAQNKMAKKYFKEAFPNGKVPDVTDVEIESILVNAHRNSVARPKVVTQVDIAGAHIEKSSKTIPADLQEVYDLTKKDVIYFSLGSYLISKLPKEKKEGIINALKEVNNLVFMNSDEIFELPDNSNIQIKSWFPQNDILGKSRVKVFITNGGTLSYQEAIRNRVAMIIIPFTGEQYRNGLRAQKDKIGVMIEFDNLDAKTLKNAIESILNDNSYYQNLKDAYEVFTSNPVEPMNEALFWIDNIAKNGKVGKLDVSHLSCIERNGLDVAAFYIGIILLCIFFWAFTITLIVKRYRQKQERGKFKYY